MGVSARHQGTRRARPPKSVRYLAAGGEQEFRNQIIASTRGKNIIYSIDVPCCYSIHGPLRELSWTVLSSCVEVIIIVVALFDFEGPKDGEDDNEFSGEMKKHFWLKDCMSCAF